MCRLVTNGLIKVKTSWLGVPSDMALFLGILQKKHSSMLYNLLASFSLFLSVFHWSFLLFCAQLMLFLSCPNRAIFFASSPPTDTVIYPSPPLYPKVQFSPVLYGWSKNVQQFCQNILNYNTNKKQTFRKLKLAKLWFHKNIFIAKLGAL